MPSDPDDIWTIVYLTFAAEGRAPSLYELARRSGLTADRVLLALNQLHEGHALVLTEDGDAIRMAHPFSAVPMGFVVTPADGLDQRLWWGGCAWDSFGIQAALGIDVRIDTACPGCGTHHTYAAGPTTPPEPDLVVHYRVPAAHWWDDVVHTCSHIRVFCDASHVPDPRGEIVPLETVWRLAQPWYGDRLAPDYEPHPREHNQQLLTDAGLVGDFWKLPS